MSKRAAVAAIALLATIAVAPVRQAGEWQMTYGHNTVVRCFAKDQVFDKDMLTRSMARVPNMNCTMDSLETVGNVTSYATRCTFQGSTTTESGTITQAGPDSYSSTVHVHRGVMKMPNGQTVAVPDTDVETVGRRLGPCKPGERPSDD